MKVVRYAAVGELMLGRADWENNVSQIWRSRPESRTCRCFIQYTIHNVIHSETFLLLQESSKAVSYLFILFYKKKSVLFLYIKNWKSLESHSILAEGIFSGGGDLYL